MNQNDEEKIKKVQEKHPKADPKIIKELLDDKESVEHIIYLYDINHKSTRYIQPKNQQQKQPRSHPSSSRNPRNRKRFNYSRDEVERKQTPNYPKKQPFSSPKTEPPPRSPIQIEYPNKKTIHQAWADPRSFFTSESAFGPKVQSGALKSPQSTHPQQQDIQSQKQESPKQHNIQSKIQESPKQPPQQHNIQSKTHESPKQPPQQHNTQSKIHESPKQNQESPKFSERSPGKQSNGVSLKLPIKMANVKYNTQNFGVFDSKWQPQYKNSKNAIPPGKPGENKIHDADKSHTGTFENDISPQNGFLPYSPQAVFGTYPYPPDLSSREPIPAGYSPPVTPYYIYVPLPPGEVPPNIHPQPGYSDHSDY